MCEGKGYIKLTGFFSNKNRPIETIILAIHSYV